MKSLILIIFKIKMQRSGKYWAELLNFTLQLEEINSWVNF